MTHLFNGFVFDPARRILSLGDKSVALTPKVRDLLLLFLRNAGTPLSRVRLLEQLWSDVVVGDDALTFQVAELRKALGDQAHLVKTIPREGYLWTGEGIEKSTEEEVRTGGKSGGADVTAASHDINVARVSSPWRRVLLIAAAVGVILAIAGLYALRQRWSTAAYVTEFSDDFDRQEIGPEYVPVIGSWKLAYGGLQGEGSGAASIDLAPKFDEDVRVEFDALLQRGGGKKEIGVFLVDKHHAPADGYYFGLGADNQIAVIDRNGIEVKYSPAPALQNDRAYHVLVERDWGQLRMCVDGWDVVHHTDPIPLTPDQFAFVRIGTYDGIIRIDNLRVSRRRVAKSIDPTVLGDQLFSRGDFDAAQGIYEEVINDQPGTSIAGAALFKVGACLLEKKQYGNAIDAFNRVSASSAPEGYKNLARLDVGTSMMLQGDLEDAQRHFVSLEAQTSDPDVRFEIANKMLELASVLMHAGMPARAEETRMFVRRRFATDPLVCELAAWFLALGQRDPAGVREALIRFLATQRRIGKPRYQAEEYLGNLQVMSGDRDAALAVYRRMEEEFKDVNTRFSIRGMFGQAMVLAKAGRPEEASAVAGRMRSKLPGDPFPERLYVQWDAFSRWQDGDYAGSAATLENALRSARPTDDETRFDRVDLALMLLQAGQRGRAEELLNPLASAGDAELSPVASLFLNKISPKELLRDEGYRSRTRSLYGVEYSLLRGRLDEARSAYEFHQAIDAFLTPLLCRVHVQAERAGIDLDP